MIDEQKQRLLASMKAIAECPIRGRIKYLDETRLVFLGQNPEDKDTYYFGFRNKRGEDTLLSLTSEAYEALKWLCAENFKGERVPFPYVLHTYWTVEVLDKEPHP